MTIFKTTFILDVNNIINVKERDTVLFLTFTNQWFPSKEQSIFLDVPFNQIIPQNVPTYNMISHYENIGDILSFVHEKSLFGGILNVNIDGKGIEPSTKDEIEVHTLNDWENFLLTFHLTCSIIPEPFEQFSVTIKYISKDRPSTHLLAIHISSYNWFKYSIQDPEISIQYGHKDAHRITVHNIQKLHLKTMFLASQLQECFKDTRFINFKRLYSLYPELVDQILFQFTHLIDLQDYNRQTIKSILLSTETYITFKEKMRNNGFNSAVSALSLYHAYQISSKIDSILGCLSGNNSNLLVTQILLKNKKLDDEFVVSYDQNRIDSVVAPDDTHMITVHQVIGDYLLPVVHHLVYQLNIDNTLKTGELIFQRDTRLFFIRSSQFEETGYIQFPVLYSSFIDLITNRTEQIAKCYTPKLKEPLHFKAIRLNNGCYFELQNTIAVNLVLLEEIGEFDNELIANTLSENDFNIISKMFLINSSDNSTDDTINEKLQNELIQTSVMQKIKIKLPIEIKTLKLNWNETKRYNLDKPCRFSNSDHSYELQFNNGTDYGKYNLMDTLVFSTKIEQSDHLFLLSIDQQNYKNNVDKTKLMEAYLNIFTKKEKTPLSIQEITEIFETLTLNKKQKHRNISLCYATDIEMFLELKNTTVSIFTEATLQTQNNRQVQGSWHIISEMYDLNKPMLFIVHCREGHLHHAITQIQSPNLNMLEPGKLKLKFDSFENQVGQIKIEFPYWLVFDGKKINREMKPPFIKVLTKRKYNYLYGASEKRSFNMLTLKGQNVWDDILFLVDNKHIKFPLDIEVGMFVLRRSSTKEYIESKHQTKLYMLHFIFEEDQWYQRSDRWGIFWMNSKRNELSKLEHIKFNYSVILVYKVDINSQLHEHTY